MSVCSLDYKEELMYNPNYGPRLQEAISFADRTLTSVLKKTIGHPKYRKNRHTNLVLDIMEYDDFSLKQRACLEIHYAIETEKLAVSED